MAFIVLPGADASGNGNDWTLNNINSTDTSSTTYDIMTDVPTLTDEDTANYAVMNPLDNTGNTLSEANLKIVVTAATYATRGTISVLSGKWYWEVTFNGGTSNAVMIGISDATVPITSSNWQSSNGWYYYGFNGNKYTSASAVAYGATYTTNDVIGVALDSDAGTLTFYKNGVSQGVAYTGLTNKLLSPNIGAGGATQTVSLNFGQRPFAYTPPAGYKKLNTFNLPDSSIVDGSENFASSLYTGTGASQTVTQTGAGFQPDLLWIKARSSALTHNLWDSARGLSKYLVSSTTAAEVDFGGTQVALNSNGFSVGPLALMSTNGVTYVGWQWKAGGTAVSNTDGTITSTVSANPTAGFSVVTYTGNGTSGAAVGHGLGVLPAMIIVKNRSATSFWAVAHKGLTAGNNLFLNDTFAQFAPSASNGGGVSTYSSTTFTVVAGTVNQVNANTNTNTFVAYCFAEVEGYSKFGSYTGNGSTDGPFVYTGFRPKFLLVKGSTLTSTWRLVDTSRSPDNVADDSLSPNESSAELVNNTSIEWDLLSNGFKCRDAYSNLNASGQTYIYMAFAENPFKNSLAR